jgi:transcriptional regulator with XRE-family HTH domain
MGSSPRPKPERLPEKLLNIRLCLELSQDGMLTRLGLDESHFRSAISGYELGTREPPLPILLKYARLAGVWADVLIDDELDLPAKLPSPIKHEGIRRHRKSTIQHRRKQ